MFRRCVCVFTTALLLSARPVLAAPNFARLGAYPLSSPPGFLTSGDLNRDGRDDVVVLDSGGNGVTILLGTPNGELTAGPTLAIGRLPSWAAVGDLNQDGIADLAVADDESAAVFIALGRGDGSFAAPAIRPVGRRPVGVAIADFDQRNGNDLAISDRQSDRVIILLNEGHAAPTFGCGSTVAVDVFPHDIVAADFNDDGRADVATLNRGTSRVPSISVLLFDDIEDGLPKFRRVVDLAPGDDPSHLIGTDLDNDGVADLALLNRPALRTDAEVVFFFGGTGADGLVPGEKLLLPCPTTGGGAQVCPPIALAAGDFDFNERVDLAVSQEGPGPGVTGDLLTIYADDGDGSFFAGPVLNTDRSPDAMVTADVTGDGLLDILVASTASNTVQVYQNVSSGTDRQIVGMACTADEDFISETAAAVTVADARGEEGGQGGEAQGARSDPCHGDCNYDGKVTLDEVVRAVTVALERQPVTICNAIDGDRNSRVTIDELVRAVRGILLGCEPQRCLDDGDAG